MKLLKYLRRNSIFSVWLISYVVMFILPLTMGLVVYFYAVDIVEGEVIRANTVILQQNQQRIDSIVSEAKSLANQIMTSPRTQMAQRSVSPMDNSERYYAHVLAQELQVYQSGNKSIADYYVYLRNADFVVSPAAILEAMSFYNIYVPFDQFSYQQWQETLFSSGDARFVRMRANTYQQDNIAVVAYIQPMPYYQKTNYSAVAVLLIDEQELLQPVEDDALFGQGAFAILDENNQVVAQMGDMPDLSEWTFSDRSGGHSAWYDNDRFITYVTSETTGWRYVGINPKRVFWAKTTTLQWFVGISMLIYLLLGIVIIAFFLRKNYAPVQELMQLLEKKGDTNSEQVKNEFSYIRKGISQAIDEKEQISETLNEQKKSMFIATLIRILEGGYDEYKQNEHFMELMEGYFPYPYFAVALFHIDDIDNLFVGEKMSKSKRYQEAKFIIENIAKELFSENSSALLFDMKNFLVCIVNRKDASTLDFTNEMDDIIGSLQDVIDQYFRFHFSVATGKVHEGIDGIGQSYQEAYSVMEYRVVFHQKDIVHYHQMNVIPKNTYYSYPLEQEIRLVNNIKAGNAEAAVEIVEQIFRDNFEKRMYSVQIVRCFMFDMISTMIRTIDEVLDGDKNDFYETNAIERLVACESVQDIKENIIKLLTEVCGYMKSRTEGSLVARVTSFVEANYMDASLNVNAIAASIGMNAAYLSTVFKEQSGQRLLDYINTVRVRHACELLLKTNSTLEEVASQTGFVSQQTFTRVFKKYRGVTPNVYRKMEHPKS